MDKQTKFYLKKLEPLVGGKITGLVEDGTGFFGLKINVKGKERALFLLRDDEGNGPGSFEINNIG